MGGGGGVSNQKFMVVHSFDIFHILCNTPCIAEYCLELNTALCHVLVSHKHSIKERLSNDLEMKTHEQNRTTNKEHKAIWLFYQRDTNGRGFLVDDANACQWVKKFDAQLLSRNYLILSFDVILRHDWPIKHCLLRVRVFFEKENKEIMCWSFHWLAYKRNSEH